MAQGIALTKPVGNVTDLNTPVGVLPPTNGGTGLTTLGSPNQVLGINAAGTAYEFKSILPGSNITIVNTPGAITISSTGGGSSLQLYSENPVSPTPPSATGTNSIALLSASLATAQDALAIGVQSVSRTQGGVVQASGRFSNSGDAQVGRYTLRNITTGAIPIQLFIDGVGGSLIPALTDNSTWTFRVTVTAHRTDALGGHAGYEFTGVIHRDAGAASVAFTGAPGKTVLAESNPPWNVTVTADTVRGGINVTVTGETSKIIRWLALVETVEVTN